MEATEQQPNIDINIDIKTLVTPCSATTMQRRGREKKASIASDISVNVVNVGVVVVGRRKTGKRR